MGEQRLKCSSGHFACIGICPAAEYFNGKNLNPVFYCRVCYYGLLGVAAALFVYLLGTNKIAGISSTHAGGEEDEEL
nr:hypothetical protein [Heyndrickxia coagulans]